MNHVELRRLCLLYLFLLVYANTVENQDICETYYQSDSDQYVLLCEQFNRTHPRNFVNELFMICSNSSSFLRYDSVTVSLEQSIRYVYNGFCSLGSFTPFLAKANFSNIFRFSSRSKNEVLQSGTFSVLCNLKEIDLSESGIEVIESEAFRCVRLIKKLRLSNNKIESLTNDVFEEKWSLKELHLDGNRLRTFALGTFDYLVSLEKLFLQKNSIDFLPDGIFRNLGVLEILNLTCNKLEDLNPNLLLDLIKLRHLYMSTNEIKYLSSNSFYNNENLRELIIDHNLELNLSADAFVGIGNLTALSMNECNLKLLPHGLFLETPNILELSIQKNNIDVITADIFSPLKFLDSLRLDSNNISELIEPFQYNKNVITLMLNKNKLSQIEEDDFKGLSLLQYLDLSWNVIEQFAEGCFKDLKKLRTLYLQHNLITSLHRTSLFQIILQNHALLWSLDLSSNKIRNLTTVFQSTQYIPTLKMNENPLILDKDSFIHIYDFVRLSLAKCNITYLPSGLFKNKKLLKSLNLYGNCLKEINPDTFGMFNSLREINLTLNNISILKDGPFKTQTGLKILYLDKNNLSEIKNGDFEGLTALMNLDLSWNSITNIANHSFDDMPKLEFLNIKHNLIFSLSGLQSFPKNKFLKEIDLSHNKLTDILGMINMTQLKFLRLLKVTNNEMTELSIPDILPVGKLIKIHLESNKIRRIHLGSEQRRDRKKMEIYLLGNLFHCDCRTYALYEFLNGRNLLPHLKFVDGLICQTPAEKKHKEIKELKPTDFTCNITEYCPNACICTYRAHDSTQSVNCSNQNYPSLPNKAPFNTSILDIRQSSVTSLSRLNDPLWENLTELYADDNLLESEEFLIPKKLKILSLRGNRLKHIPNTVKEHAERERDFKVAISHNLWACDCSLLAIKTWLSQHLKQVPDSTEVRCVFPNHSLSTVSLTMMEDSNICSPTSLFVYVVMVVIALLFTSLCAFYFKYKLYVLSFIYTHCNCLYAIFCCDRPKDEDDKLFDCFISYGADDRDVTFSILQELEEKPPHYKFCIHERNWIPGRYITNNIIVSVENSRKTLIILSKSFLKSQWFQLEFQAAYYQTLQDKKDRLIVVVVGDVPDKSKLLEDVAFVMSWKTYLLWGEKWFWEKLRYAVYEETSLTGDQNKCNLGNIFSCCSLLENDDQNQENIRMSENLTNAISI